MKTNYDFFRFTDTGRAFQLGSRDVGPDPWAPAQLYKDVHVHDTWVL